jgi:hypothetical protein
MPDSLISGSLRVKLLLALGVVPAVLLVGLQALWPETGRTDAPTQVHETHRHWHGAHDHWHRWIWQGTENIGCISGGRRHIFFVEPHNNYRDSICHIHS